MDELLVEMQQLLRFGHLEPDERAVVETQLRYLTAHESEPIPTGLRAEFERIQWRAAQRRDALLELPQRIETRVAPEGDILRWYRSHFGARKAVALVSKLLRPVLRIVK